MNNKTVRKSPVLKISSAKNETLQVEQYIQQTVLNLIILLDVGGYQRYSGEVFSPADLT